MSHTEICGRWRNAVAQRAGAMVVALLATMALARGAAAATPCDGATYPNQCGWFDSSLLPPFVRAAILSKGGAIGSGNVLVLTSGDPADPDTEISNDMAHDGCGTNPDGWQTYDCNLLDNFVPPQDSVVLALSSEWFEWYQTIYTDWMTISAGGVPTVDVSINSWINNKVDIIPYGPMDTGVVILTSLSAAKMVNFRVADSGDHIYDTAIVVVPATWFGAVSSSNQDKTLLCGDGILEPGEECDDGNTITDDGCSSICLGTQPTPSAPPPSQTCGNLVYSWPTGTTAPYTCGGDLCAGFRCVLGNTISPACYTADQCAAACAGTCVDIKTAQLDCSTMCAVQPPANVPPPVVPPTCANLVYAWPDGSTLPYTCADTCAGQRCVTGTTISPACYTDSDCAASCPNGTCVDVPTTACADLCAMADEAVAGQSGPCDPAVDTQPRLAANQKGACLGNMEVCSAAGVWKIADGSWEPQDETCNGVDDDCNGAVDDMFVTCGDPGLCQNTVNSCDPANPTVPVACVTLPPPSPVEICNDGLDNDCDGAVDDGCECGDDTCMPGETYANCPADCPPPANGTPCDDGNFCTLGDAYQNGMCVSGTIVNTCADDNLCTTNETCDPATGCSATKVDCDDHDLCTVDSCNPATGCVHQPDPACVNPDQDGDGFTGAAVGGPDCNDTDPAVHPGATEACNGVDDNCDGQIDEGFAVGTSCQSPPNTCGGTAAGVLVCSADGIGAICDAVTPPNPDNYGTPCHSAANACGATNSGTIGCDGVCGATTPPNPPDYGTPCQSAPNACGATGSGSIGCDGVCSAVTPPNPSDYGTPCQSAPNACGATGSGSIGCDGVCGAITPPNPPGYGTPCESAPNACGVTGSGSISCDGVCSAVTPPAPDADGDGTPDCLDGCPTDPNKTAPGVCGCGAPDAVQTYYRDADADGFGNPSGALQACSPPAGYVSDATDCDDSRATVHPGAAELCNGIDDNCNGVVDENADADHDGVSDCQDDLCPGTQADAAYHPPVPLLTLAPSRWQLEQSGGQFVFSTTARKNPIPKLPTIAETHGCSCKQILDRLRGSGRGPASAFLFLDQYLFGCTRGTLESWSNRNR